MTHNEETRRVTDDWRFPHHACQTEGCDRSAIVFVADRGWYCEDHWRRGADEPTEVNGQTRLEL